VTQKRLKGAERRALFLDAAAEIVIEQGVEAVTMEGVALRTGVTKALGYRYFTDRDDLLGALFDRENGMYVERWNKLLPRDAPFDEWVRGALRLWFLRADERGELFMRLVSDNGRLAEKAKALQAQNVQAWAAGVERAYRLPKPVALHLAWFMVAGTAGALAARDGDDEALIDTIVFAIVSAAEALQARHGATRPAKKAS